MVKRKVGKDVQKKRKASEANLLNVYYILGIKVCIFTNVISFNPSNRSLI